MTLLFTAKVPSDFNGQVQLGAGLRLEDRIQASTKDGKEAIKFLSKSTDHRTGESSNRTEAIIGGKKGEPHHALEGQELWYAVSFWLPAYPYKNNFTFMQFRPHGEKAYSYLGFGFNPGGQVTFSKTSWAVSPVVGKWWDWLLRVKHSAKGAGEATLEIDGKPAFSAGGLTTLGVGGSTNEMGCYMKTGIYKSASLPDAYLWMDGPKIGTTRADVEPPKPVPGPMAFRCPNCGQLYRSVNE